jgi:hypothetical protein
MNSIPKMPDEYKGKVTKSGGYTKNAPREWTEKEIQWVKELIEKGYTRKQIAESIDRSEVSTSIKIKRLSKKENTYNENHVAEKYEINKRFVEHIQPKMVLDVYSGKESFYKNCGVIANDINPEANAAYHLDALLFCCQMYGWRGKAQNNTFDIVDLDPFGSAYDCFDLAIKMARKGLVITLGELGHKRWKRLDYVRTHYGIETLENFTLERLIEHIQMIGKRNKKQLKVYAKKEWRNIGRVWFEVEPLKVTEQWNMNINEKGE